MVNLWTKMFGFIIQIAKVEMFRYLAEHRLKTLFYSYQKSQAMAGTATTVQQLIKNSLGPAKFYFPYYEDFDISII